MNNSEIFEILLVEDNDTDAELTERALKKNNLSNQIQRFSDGQEILDYLFNDQKKAENKIRVPTLILLDLKLPKVSGLEVLKIIKKDPKTMTIPIVVLTSSADDQDIAECYLLGVNSYIVKPVEFENFMESIRTLGLYWLLLNQYPPSTGK